MEIGLGRTSPLRCSARIGYPTITRNHVRPTAFEVAAAVPTCNAYMNILTTVEETEPPLMADATRNHRIMQMVERSVPLAAPRAGAPLIITSRYKAIHTAAACRDRGYTLVAS